MLLLAVMAQAKPAAPPPFGPTLPAGCNEAFLQLSLNVQEKIAAGDFAKAKALHKMLPKNSITLAWDEASIPAPLRAAYAAARDRLVDTWQRSFNGSKIEVVPYKKGMSPAPQIAITFVDSIPIRSGDAFPPGGVPFFSESPDEPRLEYVISRTRGNPAVPSDFADVHNEIAYALCQYYGLERTPLNSSFSSRIEVPTARLNTPSNHDRLLVQAVLDSNALLAKYLMKEQRIVVARPKIHFDPPAFELGTAMQGQIVPFKIQITNLGNAPLTVRAIPDCSCVSAERTAPIEPGESRLVKGQVDLREATGLIDKNLILFSNDPEKTSTFLPVRIQSVPLYRFITENGGNVLMNPGGAKTRVYLIFTEGSKMTASAVRFEGIEATAVMKPWEGLLADPEGNEGEKPRKGFAIDLNISDQLAPGRSTGTLWVQTDNPQYREIYTNLFVQKGIIALPDEIRLGQIPASPRRAAFLVSRPGKPYRITKVEADVPFLQVTAQAVRGEWEYRVTVQFDGKAAPGFLNATISVHTDDPGQPVLKVPFNAIIQ